MLDYRKANINDYNELIDMMNHAFITEEGNLLDFQNLLPKLYREDIDTMKYHFIACEDDKIQANVGALPIEMNVCGNKLNVGGIGMVSVANSARGKGYMKVLMNNAVKSFKEQNMDYGVLGGHRQRYEYFGFTPAGVTTTFILTKPNAIHLFGKNKAKTFDFVSVNENDTEILQKMEELYYGKKAYANRKKPSFYLVAKSWEANLMAVMKNNEFAGYILVGKDKEEVAEIELKNIDDLGEVLVDYFWNEVKAEKDLQIKEVQAFEVEKMKYLALVAEEVQIANQCNIAVYNFVNTIKAFAELKLSYTKIQDGSLVIEIKDCQKVEIVVDNNKVTVSQTTKEPDLKMSYLKAVQVMFGAMGHLTNFGYDLNLFAKSLFPLPLFLSHVDNV